MLVPLPSEEKRRQVAALQGAHLDTERGSASRSSRRCFCTSHSTLCVRPPPGCCGSQSRAPRGWWLKDVSKALKQDNETYYLDDQAKNLARFHNAVLFTARANISFANAPSFPRDQSCLRLTTTSIPPIPVRQLSARSHSGAETIAGCGTHASFFIVRA